MTDDPRTDTGDGGRIGRKATTPHNEDRDRDRAHSLPRRTFLRASAGASALAIGTFGATGTGAAQSVAEEHCASGANISVGGGEGVVINNDWSTSQVPQDANQCIFRNDDGSYGWSWDRGVTDACPEDCPDYPEVLIGTKPWADQTNTQLFPVQLRDIGDLDVDLDIDNGATGEEWNLALEWWHTWDRPPGTEPDQEVMLLLEWNEGHDKGEPIEEGAITDAFGNVIDYWANPGHTDWDFYIFRIAANRTPSNVDLASILAYLDDDGQTSPDLWMSGIEIGNETWDNTSGRTTVNHLHARLDGQTATTGNNDEFTEEPTGPCPGAIEVGEYCAQDPNGDGKHTDVNGNGGNDFDDVVTFFEEMQSDGVQDNVDAFDFNDNGGIDFDDVVALFERV